MEIHGYDFLIDGPREALLALGPEFNKEFACKKLLIVSPHPDDLKEATFLHRRISVDVDGWHEEIDPTYGQNLVKQQGQESARFHRVPGHVKSVKVSPAVSKKKTDQTGATPVLGETKLDAKDHRLFRGGAGLAQYMQDRRGDISFATKEVL